MRLSTNLSHRSYLYNLTFFKNVRKMVYNIISCFQTENLLFQRLKVFQIFIIPFIPDFQAVIFTIVILFLKHFHFLLNLYLFYIIQKKFKLSFFIFIKTYFAHIIFLLFEPIYEPIFMIYRLIFLVSIPYTDFSIGSLLLVTYLLYLCSYGTLFSLQYLYPYHLVVPAIVQDYCGCRPLQEVNPS